MKIEKRGVIKFLACTCIGIVLFAVNIPALGKSAFSWFSGVCEDFLEPAYPWILMAFVAVSLVLTVMGLGENGFILKNPRFKRTFYKKKMQLVTLTVSLAVLVCYQFVPVPFLNDQSESLVGMCGDMFVFLILAKMTLPLISDYGFSELLEVFLRPIMKPLLKVPGCAVIHMMASSFVSVTASTVMAGEQYQQGVYSRREAVTTITCLTIPTMFVTMLICNTVGLESEWFHLYVYILAVCLVAGVIVARLFPICRIPESYAAERQAEEEPDHESRIHFALHQASNRALCTRYNPVDNFLTIVFSMISFIPYILAWGTVLKLILAYTDIMNILTYPYGLYLELFGIEQGTQVAPVLVLNFLDVVMPTVVLTEVADPSVVIRVLCITLSQMVYIAPLLLTLASRGLSSLKEQMGIWLVRVIVLVPCAALLYPVFF